MEVVHYEKAYLIAGLGAHHAGIGRNAMALDRIPREEAVFPISSSEFFIENEDPSITKAYSKSSPFEPDTFEAFTPPNIPVGSPEADQAPICVPSEDAMPIPPESLMDSTMHDAKQDAESIALSENAPSTLSQAAAASFSVSNITKSSFTVSAVFPTPGAWGNYINMWDSYNKIWRDITSDLYTGNVTFSVTGLMVNTDYTVVQHWYINGHGILMSKK